MDSDLFWRGVKTSTNHRGTCRIAQSQTHPHICQPQLAFNRILRGLTCTSKFTKPCFTKCDKEKGQSEMQGFYALCIPNYRYHSGFKMLAPYSFRQYMPLEARHCSMGQPITDSKPKISKQINETIT